MFCPNCGAPLEGTPRFCIRCGASIAPATPPAAVPPTMAAPAPVPPATPVPSPAAVPATPTPLPAAWQPAASPVQTALAPGYPPAYAPPVYAPQPGYMTPGQAAALAGPAVMNIVGFVFVVLGIVASIIAFFLSEDGAYEWSAGIFILSAIFWVIAGLFFFMGRRHAPAFVPPPGPYPPR